MPPLAVHRMSLIGGALPHQHSQASRHWSCPPYSAMRSDHIAGLLTANGTHDAVEITRYRNSNLPHEERDESPKPGLGDYLVRFEELISDGEDSEGHGTDEDGDIDEEAFVYSSVDSDPSGGYRE